MDLSGRIQGCLIDLDGTVYQEGEAIAGAADAVAALRRAGVPFRFATNTTRLPRTFGVSTRINVR